MKLSFFGAAQTVTGSKYLLENQDVKFLIDCGFYQGLKELRLRNWAPLPFDPAQLSCVILTHAHIDHSGYIPLLIKKGFRGKIYCSRATYDLCSILLPDSGFLQEDQARRANRYGYSKHSPAEALYDQNDAIESLNYFECVDFNRAIEIAPDVSFKLSRSGHILGSSFVEIKTNYKTILFSGDLGRPNDPVMLAPTQFDQADYIVIESTYGNRLHEKINPLDEIGSIINETAGKGGTVIIPAFAVGRTQSILYYIHQLKETGAIPNLPVFVDSPMATNVTNLLGRHHKEHRIGQRQIRKICETATYTRSVEDSKNLAHLSMPSVIISASGMASGGRVLYHLKNYLGDRRNTVLFTGFQAKGTRGDRLLSGEAEIKIHGSMWQVKARVESLSSASAHADYGEILDWLGHFKNPPEKIFVTHGEKEAALSLEQKIITKFGWNTLAPDYLHKEKLF